MRLITHLLKNYKKINYFKDITAGIVVALVSIPISMGYAQIAGLPVVYGLYGSLLPILIYGLLTTSPQFVVGVDAMPAVMVGAVLAELGIIGESQEALQIVPVMSALVAVWFIIFYFVKAGRIVKYISKPVMGGFISGVGFTIILMQIPKLFGGGTGTGEIIELVYHIVGEITDFNMLSFALGLGTVVIILVLKKLLPKVPMTVIMMVLGALAEGYFHFEQYGVKMLPDVEASMPAFIIPDIRLVAMEPSLFLLQSFSIAAVIMAQTLLATGNYALKYDDKVDNGKELLAYAAMNGVSAVTGCCPINGSVSRSGIADTFGARSQIMSVTASVSMIVVILFGTPLLKYLPVPILTGIVMTALIGILEISLCGRLFQTSKREWLIFMLSFAAVLFFGTVYGVLIGCALSFADVALQATTPPTAFMGRISGQGNFYALDRNTSARPIKKAVVYRFGGNLMFANIDKFQNDIEKAIKADTKCVVVDARGISSIDVTSVDRLVLLSKSLAKRGIRFYLTEHSGHLNDQIRLLGGGYLVEEGLVRRTITLALRDAGMEKPYELEDDFVSQVSKEEEPDEMLAEFEWAFGVEAESRLKQMAEATAEELAVSVHENKIGMDILDEKRVETSWGKLGRFDENEFWDFLENKLEELSSSGRITDEELARLEKRIEERRLQGETRLNIINPHALKKLREHRRATREHIKNENPRGYEHMKKLQSQAFEQLSKRNPELAETIKELHDNKNN